MENLFFLEVLLSDRLNHDNIDIANIGKYAMFNHVHRFYSETIWWLVETADCLGRQLDRFPDTKHVWGRLQFSQPKSPQWSNLALAKIIKILWYATCTYLYMNFHFRIQFGRSIFFPIQVWAPETRRLEFPERLFGNPSGQNNVWGSPSRTKKPFWKPSKLLGSCEIQPSLMRNSHTTGVVQLFANKHNITQLSLDGLSPIISASHHEWLCPENQGFPYQ